MGKFEADGMPACLHEREDAQLSFCGTRWNASAAQPDNVDALVLGKLRRCRQGVEVRLPPGMEFERLKISLHAPVKRNVGFVPACCESRRLTPQRPGRERLPAAFFPTFFDGAPCWVRVGVSQASGLQGLVL